MLNQKQKPGICIINLEIITRKNRKYNKTVKSKKEQVLANEAPRVAKSCIQDGSQNLLYRRHEKSYIWDVAPENEMRNAKYLQIAHSQTQKKTIFGFLSPRLNQYI